MDTEKLYESIRKRSALGVQEQQKRMMDMLNQSAAIGKLNEERSRKVAIKRGCHAANMGHCFCSGKCQEIIGWRNKHPKEY